MCAENGGEHQHGDEKLSSRAGWVNLTQPGPLGWKLRRIVANTTIKVRRRQQCCGNHGEPGC
jgi:hypothetical protein